MPTDETKRIAREILAEVLANEQDRDLMRRALAGIMGDEDGNIWSEDGGVWMQYGGTSNDGYGSYSCDYWPIEAVEKIVENCEREFDEFKLPVNGETLLKDLPAFAVERDFLIREMAHFATVRLLINVRYKLSMAFTQNYEESMLTAEGTLASFIGEWATRHNAKITFNASAGIKVITKKVAKEERNHVQRIFASHTHLLTEARRGPKNKVTTDRVKAMLREHGKLSLERAAELLGCGVRTIQDWAKTTEWKTWGRAKKALLENKKVRN